jgi:protein-disulfide isomerase
MVLIGAPTCSASISDLRQTVHLLVDRGRRVQSDEAGNRIKGIMKFDTLITVVLVACAVITTSVVLRRELMAPVSLHSKADRKPSLIPLWRDERDKGISMGSSNAPVQLIEFADFECPFCGDLHKSLRALDGRYPNKIGLTYVHFPIPGHRFAVPAARAAECANDQGRFEAMYDQLFEGQDQFGLKPWDDYATTAGVPDIPAFDACIKRTNPIPRVEEGKALGAKLDVQGTPTIIINGWKLGHPPNEQELEQIVQRILAGKQPVDAKS